MSDLSYRPLPTPLRPLAHKFYRAHRSPMRPRHDDAIWVAQHGEIRAALCLAPVADGHWLTGLFVAPGYRDQGLARNLMNAALSRTTGPTWLFCHPDLEAFYQRRGFELAPELPEVLAERLGRYRRSKNLIALSAHRQ